MTNELTDRVERLLSYVDESRRRNLLLEQQIKDLLVERESLELRLASASQRIDALLLRLPPSLLSTSPSATDL
jgi:hypothetical protein